jgi:hypothetical protein
LFVVKQKNQQKKKDSTTTKMQSQRETRTRTLNKYLNTASFASTGQRGYANGSDRQTGKILIRPRSREQQTTSAQKIYAKQKNE